jgi:tetratricopeptide (TPR) repeat protein/transcriptional regulator with XRE-family HTH domain
MSREGRVVTAGDEEGTGELLRRYRLAALLTQEELASRSGVSVRALRSIELGRTARPYPRSLRLLADALALSGPERASLTGHARLGGESLAALPSESTLARVGLARPRELPGPVAHFTGREGELEELTRLAEDGNDVRAMGAVVISAIGGTPGVGKTALAVHWAHQAVDRFPDGQLYVNLRGYDPGQPVTAADALAGFLRSLGVPRPDIPPEADERAARYRTLLAGRRMLVVLDNAESVEQVRLLLPGTPGSMAVVTSRDALAGLIARDGATRLDLDVLPLADAVGLLRALIGERAVADPVATTTLAERCCRLPLALRVAAEMAAAHADASLASMTGELADQQQRLDLLEADADSRTAVRAVFSWSVKHLNPSTARMFRLAGLHPGPDFDRYAAAALTGTTLKHAGQLLDQLARAHLIQAAGPGRCTMHDLLRDYARELAAAEDGEEEPRAAMTRLFDYYLHGAAAAMDTLHPAERHRRPPALGPATMAPPLAEGDKARAWLDAELACLVAVAACSAANGQPRYAINLSATIFRYLDASGHFSEAVAIHSNARSAARQTKDDAAEGVALARIGLTEFRQGRYQSAEPHLEQALSLSRQAGDRGDEARVLNSLGIVVRRQGRHEQAADHYRLALSLFRDTGNRFGEASTLSNLGADMVELGRFEQAASHYREALALFHDMGDEVGETTVLINLGVVSMRQGDDQQAARHLQLSLSLARDAGNRIGEAEALTGFGELDLRQCHYQSAAARLQEALAIARDIGSRSSETESLSLLGDVSVATGDHEQARIHQAGALALARQTGDTYWQARAHDGLARSHHAGADQQLARYHWQQALALYTEMGTPEADQVRASLASSVPAT